MHKNAEASQTKPLKQLGDAVVVAVAGADEVGQRLDLGHPVGHDGSDARLFQHGAVVLTVAKGGGGLAGDAQPVGQRQQGRALVHALGRELDVVRCALHR